MKQIVCLKVTPKIEELKFDEQKKTIVREGVENEINDADKNALEAALRLKDKMGGTVVVLSMGPPSFEPFLRLAVAMGADDARARGSLRFSLGHSSEQADVDALGAVIGEVVERARRAAR